MLLNILHTIAITCAVGTNFYAAKPQKNEATRSITTNFTINVDYRNWNNFYYDSTDLLSYTDSGTDYRTYTEIIINKQTITTEYLNLEIVHVSQKTASIWINEDADGGYTYIGNKATNNLDAIGTAQFTENNTTITANLVAEMYYLKITTNGTIGSPYLNINNILIFANLENYSETYNSLNYLVKTTNNNLNKYFANTTTETYLDKSTLIEKYNTIETDEAGYNSYTNKQNIIYEDNSSHYHTYRKDAEAENYISLNEDTPNYIVSYTQPIRLGSDQVDYYRLDGSYNRASEDTIEITGTKTYNPVVTEIVDIPGTMIYVLGMPFTFISTAFNLTLFPGTPYVVNLSRIFLALIAVLVFVFLLKLILNAVGK